MNEKNVLVAVVAVGGLCVVLGSIRSFAGRGSDFPRQSAGAFAKVAGYKVRVVAVADPSFRGQGRLADHAWTVDGVPYEGADARLGQQNLAAAQGGGERRCVVFELEQPQKAATKPEGPSQPSTNSQQGTFDVFSYLPNSGSPGDNTVNPGAIGPFPVQLWAGSPRDSEGHPVLAQPTVFSMEYGIPSEGSQPVCLGIAQGKYKVVAQGAVSIAGLAEKQTAIIASGSWGQIEVAHLPRPMIETKPAATHRFRLLGGEFPPRAERKVLFYDSNGTLLASCGEGPNNPGYSRPPFLAHGSPADIARFEIQERPYEMVQFDGVPFNAPQVKGYSGEDGRSHAVVSPLGKVVGVIKPTKDGAWSGFVLYAADGTRWLDPSPDLAGYEYGMFDPWNHPLDDRRNILFQPSDEFLAAATPATVEVYAADSPDGPNKERLTSWNELPIRGPITGIACSLTARPYMRLEIKAGGDSWKTIKTLPVTDGMLRAAGSGPLGGRVLEVMFDQDGTIRTWQDETNPTIEQVRWRPGEQRYRAVARLRSGETVDASINMGGSGGSPPHENRYSGLEYTRQQNGTLVQSGSKNIDIKEIAQFELQVENLKSAVTIPVHCPAD